MLHGHGDDIYSQNTDIKANFSSNVPKMQDMEDMYEFWTQKLKMLSSYPEANAESFVEALADRYQLKSSHIIATHGATEAIYLVAQAFTNKASAILQPSFAEYADACRIYGHKLINILSMEALVNTDSKLIWLCNPNNPNGKVLDSEYLLEVIDRKKDVVFVVDQTYRYFTQKKTLKYKDAVNRKNLILIDSFTKRYVVPGLRLGYMVANEHIIKQINSIKPPWSVNQLAIETGKYLIENNDILPLDLSEILKETENLQKALSSIPNIKVQTGDTHFFLCELSNITAKDLKTTLINNYGILVRNADNFYGLNDYFIRIATQSRYDNQMLIDAMRLILS